MILFRIFVYKLTPYILVVFTRINFVLLKKMYSDRKDFTNILFYTVNMLTFSLTRFLHFIDNNLF